MSPLLANIYMRRFLKAWALRGNDRKFGSRIVNYADNFVILCRGHAEKALAEADQILTRIGLTINQTKTRICHAWQEPFDFRILPLQRSNPSQEALDLSSQFSQFFHDPRSLPANPFSGKVNYLTVTDNQYEEGRRGKVGTKNKS